MNKTNLTFTVDRKTLLNSNDMTGIYFHEKGRRSALLRDMGYEVGLDYLNKEDRVLVEDRKKVIDSELRRMIAKSRITKKIKKNNPDLTKKELDIESEKETAEAVGLIEVPSATMNINPKFDKFKVKITVNPPSRRRIDPINYYPTIKHIIDGLTDCGFWVDDDWSHLVEMSFAYGQVNSTKVNFVFDVEITESEDAS